MIFFHKKSVRINININNVERSGGKENIFFDEVIPLFKFFIYICNMKKSQRTRIRIYVLLPMRFSLVRSRRLVEASSPTEREAIY